MVALVMKCSSIGVGRKQFIQSNINFDSSNLQRSSSSIVSYCEEIMVRCEHYNIIYLYI